MMLVRAAVLAGTILGALVCSCASSAQPDAAAIADVSFPDATCDVPLYGGSPTFDDPCLVGADVVRISDGTGSVVTTTASGNIDDAAECQNCWVHDGPGTVTIDLDGGVDVVIEIGFDGSVEHNCQLSGHVVETGFVLDCSSCNLGGNTGYYELVSGAAVLSGGHAIGRLQWTWTDLSSCVGVATTTFDLPVSR